jgi:hypothetical protein
LPKKEGLGIGFSFLSRWKHDLKKKKKKRFFRLPMVDQSKKFKYKEYPKLQLFKYCNKNVEPSIYKIKPNIKKFLEKSQSPHRELRGKINGGILCFEVSLIKEI